jgi:hypothetical protein
MRLVEALTSCKLSPAETPCFMILLLSMNSATRLVLVPEAAYRPRTLVVDLVFGQSEEPTDGAMQSKVHCNCN